MKDLMYTEYDKKLFWVAGYDFNSNHSNLAATINNLTELGTKFATIAGVPFEKICTSYIESSRRYKYMRVFYCDMELKDVPETAFIFRTYTEENRKEIIPHLSGYNLEQLQNTMWRILTD